MPSLRERLKRPHLWLGLLVVTFALGAADSFRAPDRQVTSGSYVAIVRVYQRLASPVLSRWIRCRYRPPCSSYSVDAVRRYGIRMGLELTVRRVRSCTRSVAPGTHDPLP